MMTSGKAGMIARVPFGRFLHNHNARIRPGKLTLAHEATDMVLLVTKNF
jgi:hypothetical protein